MKAAIITLAYEVKSGTNYGNRLQNYALQELLITLEMHPETIAQHNVQNLNTCALLTEKVKYLLRVMIKKNYRSRQNSFIRFNKLHIKWGNKRFIYNKIPLGLNNEYDYFVVGSDQVWNTDPKDMRDRRNIYLASFADPSKRIAYAASFGISYILEDCIEDYKRELPKFKAISVRELEGVRLVEECGAKATVVLDPTLMLTDKQWNTLAHKPRFDLEDNFILTYFLGIRDETMCRYAEKIANGRKIVNLNDKNNTQYYSVSPDEFVWLFAHADCILTDSFHGTVFSILYHRPFMVFDRIVNGKISGMESRIDTLLSTFHLEQCRGDIDNPHGEPVGGDWDEVDRILAAEREKSLAFLKNALDLKE